jgi:hypothetical protein
MSYNELSAHPLAIYSASFWHIHTCQVGQNWNTIDQLGEKLLSPEQYRFENCLCLYDEEKWHSEHDPIQCQPLNYMVLYGIVSFTGTLIKGEADINAKGGAYGSGLHAPSKKGHLKVVRLLLDNGADANAEGRIHGTALQAASAGGHLKIVRLLLDHGADANVQGGYHGTALQAVLKRDHPRVVRLLLGNGADANAQGG